MNSIIKKTAYTYNKKSGKDFDRLLKQFFHAKESFFTVPNLNNFFTQLKQNDYGMQYDGTFYIEMNKNLLPNGRFAGGLLDDYSWIEMRHSKEIKNLDYKKSQMIFSYMHECAHAEQFFHAVRQYNNGIKPKNETEKVFLDSYYLETSFENEIPYEFTLTEVNANMIAILNYVNKMKNNIIPVNMEGLMLLTRYYSFIFSGCNIYNEDEFWECDSLKFDKERFIDYFKTQYSNWKNKNEKFKLKDTYDKINFKRPEIDFEKLADEVEKLFDKCINELDFVYAEILKRYTPSIEMAVAGGFEEFRVPTQEEWFKLIEKKHPLKVMLNIFAENYDNYILSRKKYSAKEFDNSLK